MAQEKSFTEDELNAAVAKATEAVKVQLVAEFAEKSHKAQVAKDKAEIAAFVESGVAEGKVLPAWKETGLTEFMESIADSQPVDFGEAKKTPLAWFKEFIQSLPNAVSFGELATKGKAPNTSDDSPEKVAENANKLKDEEAKAGNIISYSEAVTRVISGGMK